ncbi:carbohydrate-binding protein, partial [Schleiferiaceae bacterium]|nr:carbohydrate-binding protein [Schleiferiaceae bacterium]
SGSTGGNFYFEADGVRLTPNYYATNTGSWTVMSTKTIPNVVLSADDKKIRFVANQGGFNVTSFEFVPTGSTTTINAEYVHSVTYDNSTIEVQTNKPLDSANLGTTASYYVTVNGVPASITSVTKSPSNSRNVLIGIGQALTFLDEIKISYAGTTLQAKDGTNVQSFSQELVENTLPTVHVIPGKIEAEAFTTMDGIALENTTDIGGGQNIGYLGAGDYLIYDVKVLNSATYSVDYRHASLSGVNMQFIFTDTLGNYVTSFPSISLGATGGWQTWQTTNQPGGILSQGDYKLRLDVGSEFNLNWFEFIQGIGFTEQPNSHPIMLFPNPTSNALFIDGAWASGTALDIFIYDTTGKLWLREKHTYNGSKIQLGIHALPNGTFHVTAVSPSSRFTEQLIITR